MANNHSDLTSLFTDIADAIRSKTGGSDPIVADQFPEAIEGISGGGADDGFPIGDGNTHIWIDLSEGRTSPMMGLGVNGTVTVDWGDGTTPDTLTGTSETAVVYTPNHQYEKAGRYIITLTVNGTMQIRADGYNFLLLRSVRSGDNSAANTISTAYKMSVKKVEVGNNVSKISDKAFYGVYSLSALMFQDGITSIGNEAFLASCLTTVVFPQSLTAIGSGAFSSGYLAYVYDFSKCTAVPTLSNTNAFMGIPADCQILVPSALVDEWKAATNWSTYADYIVGV